MFWKGPVFWKSRRKYKRLNYGKTDCIRVIHSKKKLKESRREYKSLSNLDSNLHNSKTLIMDTCLFKVTYETKHDESSVSERFIWVVSSTF